jgi:hypothetical protein
MNTLILDEDNGRIILNHNQTVVRPKPFGGLTVNHNQTVVRTTTPNLWPQHNQTLRTAR